MRTAWLVAWPSTMSGHAYASVSALIPAAIFIRQLSNPVPAGVGASDNR